MNELDLIVARRRADDRRAQAAADVAAIILFAIGYLIYRLVV